MNDRRLLNVPTTISLALCVATVALWAVSLGQSLGVEREASGRMDWLFVAGGRFIWSISIAPAESPGAGGASPSAISYRWYHGDAQEWDLAFQWDDAGLRSLGFAFMAGGSGGGRWLWTAIPCWFLLGLFAVYPGLRARSIHLARRPKVASFSPVCNYDLLVTPDAESRRQYLGDGRDASQAKKGIWPSTKR